MKHAAKLTGMHPKMTSTVYKNLFIVLMMVMIGIPMVPGASRASSVPLNSGGIYSAAADDGGKISLYRYAPYTTETPQFRMSGTPIVIFTGIVLNMNQYLSCTPADMTDAYSAVYVPPVSSAPAWALNSGKTDYEASIKADKMRYYSLAHYLWLQGYDPWLVNFRDTGRSPLQSTGTNVRRLNTLDTWATLDTPAAIAKVKSVTGKRMFIGGHSTGSFVSYAYLQGAYLDAGAAATADAKKAYYQLCYLLGFQPHVKASAALAKTRNADIKGVIGLDPAGVPPLPNLLDLTFIWTLVGSKVFLPLDDLSQNILQQVPTPQLVGAEEVMFGVINKLADQDSLLGDLFRYLNFWVVKDMDPCMEDWFVRYSLGGSSLRGFGQYMDLGLNNTIREHYLNGKENYSSAKLTVGGPTPYPGKDGYYYYSENMSRLTVPLIVFSSSEGSLVSPANTYDFLISKKSPTAYDKWYVVGGTGHIDMMMGKKTPSAVFTPLGDWLKIIDALPCNPANTTEPASRIDE